jgi:hypothetical protein
MRALEIVWQADDDVHRKGASNPDTDEKKAGTFDFYRVSGLYRNTSEG